MNLNSLFKQREITSDCSKYTMERKPFFCVLNLLTLADVFPVSESISSSWNLCGPSDTNTRVSEIVLFLFVKPVDIKNVALFNSNNRHDLSYFLFFFFFALDYGKSEYSTR